MTAAAQSALSSRRARWAERAHYLDLIQIYTGLGDESDIDLILMHLPRVESDRRRAATDSLARKGLIE
jgi:hypothetical protein